MNLTKDIQRYDTDFHLNLGIRTETNCIERISSPIIETDFHSFKTNSSYIIRNLLFIPDVIQSELRAISGSPCYFTTKYIHN